jgi:hypothetical protein
MYITQQYLFQVLCAKFLRQVLAMVYYTITEEFRQSDKVYKPILELMPNTEKSR